MRVDIQLCKGIDDSLFQQRNQLTYAQLTALKIQQYIHHLLARAVVSDLPAAIALDYGNISRH